MAKFNNKEFNPQVFEKYSKTLPTTKENSLVNNAILTNVNKYGRLLSEQAGGNYIVEPIKGRIGGDAQNYDGQTDIQSTSRKSFKQGKVVIGRDNAWGELDFSEDITSTSWLAEASEINEYWNEQKQGIILSVLKGIFASTANNFGASHTVEIDGNLAADTANKASQKVLGDKKKNLKVMFMHSTVSTNLESLQLLEFLKYTDANGVQRDLTIGTFNGKLVVIDDEMPAEEGFYAAKSTDEGALKVVASGATTGEINIANVKATAFYPKDVKANDYVVLGDRYTTYVMSNGFFEYEEVGVKVPYEVARDAKTDGGRTDLISRKRFVIVPQFISFTKAAMATDSPTKAELENGTNWEPVNDGTTGSKDYINDKLIPIVRIFSRG